MQAVPLQVQFALHAGESVFEPLPQPLVVVANLTCCVSDPS
jgi:hypothetical protein